MTTLSDRPNTALMVIDVQNGVVADAYDRDAVVANIEHARRRARREERARRLDPAFQREPRSPAASSGNTSRSSCAPMEPLVHKTFPDSFEGTELEDVLAAAGIGHLDRGRRADRRVHPVHDPRRVRRGATT